MFGFAIRFKMKRSLIGIAAASLLAPIASHADVSPGRWIFDGFTRSTRDGQGSTCVSSSGETYAFDSPECTGTAETAKAKRQAEQAKRDAAKAAEMEERAKARAAAPVVAPGALLPEGSFGSYVRRSNGNTPNREVRDGFGRNCVKDGLWTPGVATEQCDPNLFSAWRAANPEPAAGELAPRIQMPPPEVNRSARSAAAADVNGAAQPDPGPGIAPPAEKLASIPSIIDNTIPAFPVTVYALDSDAQALVPEDDGAGMGMLDDDDASDEAAAPGVEDEDEAAALLADESDGISDDATSGVAADEDDEAEEALAADSDEDGEDDPLALAGGAMLRDDENLALVDADDAAGDDDDLDGLLVDDEAPMALAAVAPPVADDDDEEEEGAPVYPEEDDDTPYLGDAVEATDEPAAVTALADDGDEDDETGVAASEAEDDDETAYLGDREADFPVHIAGVIPAEQGAVATLTDDGGEPVFPEEETTVAEAGDEGGPPVFPQEEPAALEPMDAGGPPVFPTEEPVITPEPAAAPKAPVETVAAVDQTPAEFPITKYEVEQPAPVKARPEPRPAPEVECPPVTIQMDPGLFDFDQWKLRPELISSLDAIAAKLKTTKCEGINVVGHTDRIGSRKYNQGLSERRANAVKEYLVEQGGVDPSLITTSGAGESKPVTKLADCKGLRKKKLIACFAPDRRVEVTVRILGEAPKK
jgi:outer membrane protein OmpA-like peptidoglycan-associated protein